MNMNLQEISVSCRPSLSPSSLPRSLSIRAYAEFEHAFPLSSPTTPVALWLLSPDLGRMREKEGNTTDIC